MKTNFVRQISLGLAAGLIFFLGCARPSARQEQPKVSATPVVVAQAVPAVAPQATPPAAPAAPDPKDTNAPAILERIQPSTTPENVALSPGLSEVVKLAQAGVSEDVMLAYVDKYASTFNIGADQILYLNDLGISSTVITSMLKHDGVSATAATALAQAQAVSNAPQNQVYPQQPAQAEAPLINTAVAPPTASMEVSYFYDSLSPYGSWIYLSGYGWCWQPTVAVSVPSWRPYSDRGRWYWSDAGWYWNSDYSWGWAAFHYGRWYHHAGSGWMWTPGVTWAPSWVSWRYSDGYCGWAPLPPEAHFVHGGGFTYYGRSVSIGFEFGLSDYHYSFVGIRNFCDYSPSRHFVSRNSVRNVYRNTTVINNYIVGNNNTVINRGVGRETIARNSTTRVREVSVRESQVQNLASVRGERIQRQGDQSVVYRPQLPRTPQVRTAQFATRSGGSSPSTVGRTAPSGSTAATTQPSTVNRQQSRGNNDARVANGTRLENPRATTTETRREQPVANEAGRTARSGGELRRDNQPAGNENRAQRAVPNAAPQTRASQQAQPQPQQQPQQQQRGNRTLFGDSGARATTPNNNTTTMLRTEPKYTIPSPRTQNQPSYNVAPGTRVYPQATAPLQQQPASRYDLRNQAPAVMSPRGAEQSQRANVPTHTAPTYSAPRESRQESRQETRQESRQEVRQESRQDLRQAPSPSSGGSRNDSGSSGNLRQGGRNR